MAEVRGGWRRRRRADRSRRLPSDYGDDDVEHIERFSLRGHRDAVSHERRNTALDDALFGFFMKESVNTMKRNFSEFRQDTLDVAHNGLRIPKEIASVLDIPKTREVTLIYAYDWNNYEVSYYTCKDERMCFRDGWPQFAAQHNIVDGSIVLVLFYKKQ